MKMLEAEYEGVRARSVAEEDSAIVNLANEAIKDLEKIVAAETAMRESRKADSQKTQGSQDILDCSVGDRKRFVRYEGKCIS